MNLPAKRRTADLTNYNPTKGLKTVAVAEAAEKHYARAKDASKLQVAIRAKLEAQAEFVFWWDTKGPGSIDTRLSQPGPGRGKRRPRSETPFSSDDSLPDRRVVHRWRQKLNDPQKFETTFEEACAKYSKILEFLTIAHVGQNSGENEWYTPKNYADAARNVLGGIDLDPATSEIANETIQASQIFTADDSGLTQQWDGRVWMNPPYAQPLIAQFCDKLAESVRSGSVPSAVVLVNNATETAWFQALVSVASAICFPLGRVRFVYPGRDNAAPLQGQAVVYVGGDVDRFAEEFSSFGFIATIRR